MPIHHHHFTREDFDLVDKVACAHNTILLLIPVIMLYIYVYVYIVIYYIYIMLFNYLIAI